MKETPLHMALKFPVFSVRCCSLGAPDQVQGGCELECIEQVELDTNS